MFNLEFMTTADYAGRGCVADNTTFIGSLVFGMPCN